MAGEYSNYEDKFITLADLKLPELPNTIEISSEKFIIKPEFHITLLAVERAAEIIGGKSLDVLQKEIVAAFEEFVTERPLTEYKLITNDLRLVRVDGNKTIIVMAEMPRIQELFDYLGKKFKTELPVQPTHITLYTLPGDTFGIPIYSYEDLEDISEPIKLPQVQKLLS